MFLCKQITIKSQHYFSKYENSNSSNSPCCYLGGKPAKRQESYKMYNFLQFFSIFGGLKTKIDININPVLITAVLKQTLWFCISFYWQNVDFYEWGLLESSKPDFFLMPWKNRFGIAFRTINTYVTFLLCLLIWSRLILNANMQNKYYPS